MVSNLKGFYYFGKLTKIIEKKYTSKDGKEWINYDLEFSFMWGKHTISSNKEINSLLEEWKDYALPIAFYTNLQMDFSKMFVRSRDSDSIYCVVDDELILIN